MRKRYKLLTPSGKMLSISQVYRLNISRIFDILIKLGVTDIQHYITYMKSSIPKKLIKKIKKTPHKTKSFKPSKILNKIKPPKTNKNNKLNKSKNLKPTFTVVDIISKNI